MKKIIKITVYIMIFIFVTLLLMVNVNALCSDFSWDGGDGTPGNPYGVQNCNMLQQIGQDTDCLSKSFQVTQNIDCSDTVNWNDGAGFEPIGNSTSSFEGTFDGKNHIISNLFINRSSEKDVGLFAETSSFSQIFDLTLLNVYITGDNYVGGVAGTTSSVSCLTNVTVIGNITGNNYVGGVAGISHSISRLTNVTVIGNIKGNYGVGGVVGSYNGGILINQCYFIGNVSGTTSVGGLVGVNYLSKITNSYSVGTIIGSDRVGGFVGHNYKSSISQVYFIGNVSGTTYVGGLVGSNPISNISESYSIARVNGSDKVGGLIGGVYYSQNNRLIFRSYSSGSVTGHDYVGGFIGFMNTSDYQVVKDCYSTSNVSGASYVGGFIGRALWPIIESSYSVGHVTGNGTYVGAFVGEGVNIFDCFWDEDTSGMSFGDGGNSEGSIGINANGVDDEFMRTEYPYKSVGWDFNNTWSLNCGDYPHLQFEGLTTNFCFNLSGSGTSLDPYLITSCTDLEQVMSYPSAHYKLENDIDCSDTRNWVNGKGFRPLYNYEYGSFFGVLDGNNHMISGLFINRSHEGEVGLFGASGIGSQIYNLVLSDVYISGSSDVGSFVGYGRPNLSNVSATGVIVSNGVAGGIIGEFQSGGVITNSHFVGNVTGGNKVGGLIGLNFCDGLINSGYSVGNIFGNSEVGGLIGENFADNSVSNSYFIGNVSGTTYVGGLVGRNSGGNFSDSHVSAIVNGQEKVGGFVGSCGSGRITNSHFVGNVTGDDSVGGFVGYFDGGSKIYNSYSSSNVNGQNYVGGFAGKIYNDLSPVGYYCKSPVIYYSYSKGNVNGQYYVGGFAGSDFKSECSTHIYDCYSLSDVSGISKVGGFIGALGNLCEVNRAYSAGHVNAIGQYIGGLIGYIFGEGFVYNAYWDINKSGMSNSAAGTGRTTSLMQQQTNYYHWDFNNIWGIDDSKNFGYPFFRWQKFESTSLPRYSSFISFPHTTNLSAVPDLTNVTNLTLETLFGMLQFPHDHSVNVSGQNLDDNIIFGDCFVSVNSSGLDYTFNATAYLTLNNSDGHCGDDRIYYAPGVYDNADAIRQHDTVCSDCIKLIADNHKVKFRVYHFSSYAIGSNANLTIYDSYENSAAQPNADIIFYANYTNKSGSHISGATCTIYFDGNTNDKHNMTDNGNNYNYTYSFGSPGTHNYNITCSATNYNTLSAVDDVQVGSGVVPEFSLSLLFIVSVAALILFIVFRNQI